MNGIPAGEARYGIFWGYSNETLYLGIDTGSPFSKEYASPFAFTGTIDKVEIRLK